MKSKAKKSTKPLLAVLLLDETGSMASLHDDVVRGYNEYVKALQKADKQNVAHATLITFDSRETCYRYTAKPVAEIKPMKRADYNPGLMTNLCDATMAAIQHAKSQVKLMGGLKSVDVVIVIQTDGQENASERYTATDVSKKIGEMQDKHGWKVEFLGTGIDAWDEGAKLGFVKAQSVSVGRDKYTVSMATAGRKVGNYIGTRDASDLAYSDDERKKLA